jgi:hypothetical protein
VVAAAGVRVGRRRVLQVVPVAVPVAIVTETRDRVVPVRSVREQLVVLVLAAALVAVAVVSRTVVAA